MKIKPNGMGVPVMNRAWTVAILILVGLVVPNLSIGQEFGAYSHVDELAFKVRNLASKTCWEMNHHYRSYPDYRETYREAYEMYTIANHIHDLVHNSARRETIQRNVQDLDKLFHHIEADARAWGVYGHGVGGHGIDHHGHHGHTGHSRLKNQMMALEDALHHLMDDVGVHTAFPEGAGISGGNGNPPPLP